MIMHVGQRQLIEAINQIVREELALGQVPTVQRIMQRVNERFAGKTLGRPLFQVRPATYRGRSRSADWNAMVHEIDADLQTLFRQHVHQADLLVRHFGQLDSRIRRLYTRIAELYDRILDMFLVVESIDGYFAAAGDAFRSLVKVDMNQTTAWIDLETGEVMPPIAQGGNRKVPLLDAQASVELENEKGTYTSFAPPSYALDDDYDTAWLGRVSLPEPDGVRLHYTVHFSPARVSRFRVSPKEANPSLITLSISADGMNFVSLGTRLSETQMIWDIAPQRISAVRVTFERDVYDAVDAGSYRYDFGLRTVSLEDVGWEEQGTLVTLPIPVTDLSGQPAPLNRVSLKVEEEIPPGADIRYYVAIDEPNPVWHPISPQGRTIEDAPAVLPLGQVMPAGPYRNIPATAPTLFQTVDGVDFYVLHTLNTQGQALVPRSVRLIKGVGQWRRESYIHSRHEQYVPSLLDWSEPPVDKSRMEVRYVPAGMSFPLPAASGLNCRFYTTIRSPREASVTWRLTFTHDVGVQVYVNNQPAGSRYLMLPNGQATVSIDIPIGLRPGDNHIQILIYRNGSGESYIQTSANLASYGDVVVDPEPLLEVSPFELFHNVPYRDDTKFAVVGNDIIVNEYTVKQEARYEVSFKRNAHGQANRIRLRADLFSPGPEGPPPKLKGYTIFFGY